jgi:uncharacterized glyoxalase superfamily protein PhnB
LVSSLPAHSVGRKTLKRPGSTSRGQATAAVVPQISVEVADVDAVHAEALRRGLELVHPLTDEPWGVRRFFVKDPNGVVLNVVSHRGDATTS